MTDIEMLSLPPRMTIVGDDPDRGHWVRVGEAEDYARAVAEHNVKALQAELDNRWAQGVHTFHDKCQRIACVLRRENEALRAEVAAWRELSDHVRAGACNAIWPDRYTDARTRDVAAALKRAERLAEALQLARHLVEDWAGYAGEYFQEKHDLTGDLVKIDAALRDHGQEVGNG